MAIVESATRHMGVACVYVTKIFTSHLLFMVIIFSFFSLLFSSSSPFFFPLLHCHHCWLALSLPLHTSQNRRTMHQTVISFDCSPSFRLWALLSDLFSSLLSLFFLSLSPRIFHTISLFPTNSLPIFIRFLCRIENVLFFEPVRVYWLRAQYELRALEASSPRHSIFNSYHPASDARLTCRYYIL